MFQRKANMKPATLSDRYAVDAGELIKFCEQAMMSLDTRGLADEAFRFEMFAEYLRNDYKPGQSLKFSGRAIGL